MQMRSCFAAVILSLAAPGASANILISVDKSSQRMTVSVDSAPRYQFVVSTGRAGYGTPNGTYHPQRLERTWFSKEYYNSPMPYSIFFHGGYAIHGSYEIHRLGGPPRTAASDFIPRTLPLYSHWLGSRVSMPRRLWCQGKIQQVGDGATRRHPRLCQGT